ncbi:MAG: hypothetical protein RRY79_04475 [Clostridia bacterium]
MTIFKKIVAAFLATATLALCSVSFAAPEAFTEYDSSNSPEPLYAVYVPSVSEDSSTDSNNDQRCARTYLTQTWNDFSDMKSLSTIRSITLSLRSVGRSIKTQVIILTNGFASKVGFTSFKLQRYTNGRWTTIQQWSSRYMNNTSSFSFSSTITNVPVIGSYRLVGSFIARVGGFTTYISRVTGSIQCR